jgi:hypothetical protein
MFSSIRVSIVCVIIFLLMCLTNYLVCRMEVQQVISTKGRFVYTEGEGRQ